ncbi:bifunctional diguanylate cyclase/phosphodiesterase [Roseomonas sp. HJA6]|uniref:Bifunctional diguanylate cyclase/phosphodiesterase n=1 Tax=Roseomonas alba TaxID=2846776 RepID=A0ABS7A5B7_9PROT|nr:bifunctional diguanylate cyclase/phosphodiesterase [Neoroseomonas alba]MBW6397507.1 bifunctional diguanylate cyclase/phosphodiesterase [Neoroseomonas alba]
MDGMADGDGAPKPGGQEPDTQAAEGLLSFDAELNVGLVSGRAVALLGLPRSGRHARGLHDVLEASPRLDRDAVAALVAQCLAATLPGAEDEFALHLPGAPGLRFSVRRASGGSWVIALAAETRLAGGTGGFDPLTGLADRAMFEARLAAALDRPPRRRAGSAVLLCDLEGIRAVNNVLGHAIGEDLLRAAGRRLQAAVRDADLVARMAGEEFAVLQTEVADGDHAAALGRRLVELLGRPYLISGETVVVTPRIGIAVAPTDGMGAAELLRRAAMARNETCAEGAGGFRRFSPEMDRRWQERRAMEVALRRAVAENAFELHFQPQVALPEGRLTGFEALIRWRHPDRGMLAPPVFLPVAEQLGLMQGIGSWVLREACRIAAGWPAPLTVAVNIAPAQLEEGRLPEEVAAALADSGLPADRLELEVTETVLLANADSALSQLLAIRASGVGIAMDDFGTGYSSLTQLRVFPFDQLKIDRSFVQDLPAGGDAAAIVRAVTGLGRSLGMAVIAEGVETEEQLDRLRAEGCDVAQGYLFGRAVPVSQIPDVIRALSRPDAAALPEAV